jgi:hypothetical protein
MIVAVLLALLALPGALAPPAAPRRLQAAYEPRQVHLGYTGDGATGLAVGVVVEWITTAEPPGDGKTSRVVYRRPNGPLSQAWADTVVCGLGSSVYTEWSGAAHEAKLVGLTPGVAYQYRVGSDEGWTSWLTFVTPSPTAATASLIIASGISAGTDANLFWDRMRREPMDLLVLPGNLNFNNYSSSEAWDTFFDAAQPVLSRVPAVIVGGGLDAVTEPAPPGVGFHLRFPKVRPPSCSRAARRAADPRLQRGQCR